MHTSSLVTSVMLWGWWCSEGPAQAGQGAHRQPSHAVLLQLLLHKHG